MKFPNTSLALLSLLAANNPIVAVELASGTVTTWGLSIYGGGVTATDISRVSCGEQGCAAIKVDGSVVVWGSELIVNSLPVITNGSRVSCGRMCCAVIKKNGTVQAWVIVEGEEVPLLLQMRYL